MHINKTCVFLLISMEIEFDDTQLEEVSAKLKLLKSDRDVLNHWRFFDFVCFFFSIYLKCRSIYAINSIDTHTSKTSISEKEELLRKISLERGH